MLAQLGREFRLSWIEAIGTDSRYPITEGWPGLVQQLIDFLEQEHKGEPVYAVGHSLGGYLSLLAAARRPALFRAIVLLDAPILGRFRGMVLRATKRLGIVDRVTPAVATRERRSHWRTRDEARAHLRSRPLFRHFTDACLEDYVGHGLVREGGALRLRIDPRIETHIYRTFPHAMPRQPAVPTGFIGGAHSDVVRRMGLRGMRKRFVIRSVPGGHLFPFERPREAAAAILELIARLG